MQKKKKPLKKQKIKMKTKPKQNQKITNSNPKRLYFKLI